MDARAEHKKIERTYYTQIGAAGMDHAMRKPFADESRGQLLLGFGAVLSLMPPPPAKVIDFGCGVGWTTDFLARSGYQATGVDLSPEAIAAATTAYASDNARFLVHDYEEDVAEAGSYDIALFFDALHHCTDVDAALASAANALRPGGICVVAEPGRGHSHALGALEAQERFGVAEGEMPPDRVVAAARRVGFRSSALFPLPAEIQQLLYARNPPRRTGLRRLLNTRPGRWLLTIRAMDFSRRRGGVVWLER